jgi:hypothetical protein
MYTLVSYMYNFDSVQITVVLNVQNFGKCLIFLFQSVDHKDNNVSSMYPLVSKLYSIAVIQPLSTAEVERLFSIMYQNCSTNVYNCVGSN